MTIYWPISPWNLPQIFTTVIDLIKVGAVPEDDKDSLGYAIVPMRWTFGHVNVGRMQKTDNTTTTTTTYAP